MSDKSVIAIDISSSRRGGPYIACKNILESSLQNEFDFKEIIYDNSLGRFISWKRILNLKHQLDIIKPDGIIITGLQLSCFHVCAAAMLAGVRTRIITIHGSSTEALCLSRSKKLILYLIEFMSLWMCTSFYGVSKYASNLSAAKWFKRKNLGYVYNIPTKEKICERKLTRDDLGLSTNDIVVTSSGRIIKEKGYAVLADAINRINDPNIKFIILGDGNYLKDLKNDLSQEINDGKVICPGFIENVYEYLKLSDIFVLPTLHETLSVSLLEASYASLPLISCNVGGVPEVIENGVNGILVEANDATALKNAITYLAYNPEIRLKMGANSLMRLRRVFSKDIATNDLKKIIETDISRWKNA